MAPPGPPRCGSRRAAHHDDEGLVRLEGDASEVRVGEQPLLVVRAVAPGVDGRQADGLERLAEIDRLLAEGRLGG